MTRVPVVPNKDDLFIDNLEVKIIHIHSIFLIGQVYIRTKIRELTNLCKNVFRKIRKSSKGRQDQKTLIFVYYLSASA